MAPAALAPPRCPARAGLSLTTVMRLERIRKVVAALIEPWQREQR